MANPLDNNKIVAFCFYENPVTDIYFSIRPEYEELAPFMVEYADQYMPDLDGKNNLLFLKNKLLL